MPRDPELTAYLTRFAGQDEVLARVERETRTLPNAGMLSRPADGGENLSQRTVARWGVAGELE